MSAPDDGSLNLELLDILNSLDDDELETFKFVIVEENLFRDYRVIRSGQLQTTDRRELVTIISKHYGIFTTVIVKTVLKEMHKHPLKEDLSKRCPCKPEEVRAKCSWNLKSKLMKELLELLSKEDNASGGSLDFNEVYTDLHLNEGGLTQIVGEHEVSQMERDSRNSSQERTIRCQDIFKNFEGKRMRMVLSKGVAGVGKTVLTQKFIWDWAKEIENRDIDLLFPFTFRELNEERGKEYSMIDLLHEYYPETKMLFNSLQQLKIVFILDGLDECKLPLDFSRETNPLLTDLNKSALVEKLMVNLIRGDLCPTAHIWVTTRPAAAKQIEERYISMVTDVRGFTDEQKEEFFRKSILDEQQATDIINHIKKTRSLFTLCHAPIFCWIVKNVFLHLKHTTGKLPSTLTEIYAEFLEIQAQVLNEKYEGSKPTDDTWNKKTIELIWSLARLAFEQLMKGNLIFSKEDMSQCGLNTDYLDHYSVFKEFLKKERNRRKMTKVYCFIHMSFQEFLAALHVHHIFINFGVNLLSPKYSWMGSTTSTAKSLEKLIMFLQRFTVRNSPKFYRCAVKQTLRKTNGELDLVLRFLLGLSLPTNQELLEGLLALTGSEKTNQETVQYIKNQLNEDVLASDQKLNLLHCLNELNDQSLLEEIQNLLSKEELSGRKMSPADWAALSFILLSSDSDLEEFELRKYGSSEEALQGLLLVIKGCTKANLNLCNLTEQICSLLASVLVSSSSLKHLDLSNNDLQDSGVEQLCEGLKRAPCRLETLSLNLCNLTEQICSPLASVLVSSSSLKHLDLSNNDLQDSGVEQLCEGLKSLPCRLETLSLTWCNLTEQICSPLASVLVSSSSLRHLDLSNNDLQDSGVEQLCERLKSVPSRLETLR